MKKFLKVLLFLILLGVGIFLIDKYQKKNLQSDPVSTQTAPVVSPSQKPAIIEESKVKEKQISQKTGPKEMVYSFQYKDQEYEFSQTLYKSIYDFYVSQPKVYIYSGEIPQGWEDEYYGIFLQQAKNDASIQEIVSKFREFQKQRNLTDDQLVELAVVFVQSFFYDSFRAKEILKGSKGIKPRYPYEVLYEKKAVCSGKSFLLAALLRELNYGAALFEYPQQNHMAVGVLCPVEYSTEGTGYCYIETTTLGHNIGVVPTLDEQSNEAVSREQIDASQEDSSILDQIKPSNVRVFQKTQGKTYEGVGKTFSLMKEMEGLELEIPTSKKNLLAIKKSISQKQDKLREMEKELNQYKNTDDSKYNKLVPDYNELVNQIKEEVKVYNQKVIEFNQKVDRYNAIIKELK
ncbi:MAG: hypothetical protein GF335_00120 [Candidatus Moranbacteria bacterium]|nr:hypothetical protein [Candidatus Moranbacteria bacterium]